MEPDKAFLLKLWDSKWTRWGMILALVWPVISIIKDSVFLLYERGVQPAFTYIVGIPPKPDLVSNDRHAFLAGYYSYQLYAFMRTGGYSEWPVGFADQKNRLEASLISLGFPNSALVHEINPSNVLDAVEKYQRIRSLTEAYLDKKGESSIAAFYVGLDIALLMEESSGKSLGWPTIGIYVRDLKTRLATIRETTMNRLPTLPAEQMAPDNCCSNVQKSFVDSFVELKKFYGVTLN